MPQAYVLVCIVSKYVSFVSKYNRNYINSESEELINLTATISNKPVCI